MQKEENNQSMQVTYDAKVLHRLNNDLTELPEFAYNSTRRFDNADDKRLYNEFVPQLRNRYLGFFIVDNEYKWQNEDKSQFHYASEGTTTMLNEIVQWSVGIVDREYLENNSIEHVFCGGVKRYLYMADEEIYNICLPQDGSKPPIVSNPKYPGVRIFESYATLIRHIEHKFFDQNIFILAERSLYTLKYFLKGVHLVRSKELTVNDAEEFPFKFYKEFCGINLSSKKGHFDMQETINPDEDTSLIEEEAEKEELISKLFAGNVTVNKRNVKKLAATIKKSAFSYEIMYQKKHNTLGSRVSRLAKRAWKHISYAGIPSECIMVMHKGDKAYFYDNRYDMIIDIKPFEELQSKDLAYTRDKPFKLAITESALANMYANEDLVNATKECISNHIQIQTR